MWPRVLDEDLVSGPLLVASQGASQQRPLERACQHLWILRVNQFCDRWAKEFSEPPYARCNYASPHPKCFKGYQPEGFVARWHGDDARKPEEIGKAFAIEPARQGDFDAVRHERRNVPQGGEFTRVGAGDYAREPWDVNVVKRAQKNIEPLAPGESTGGSDHWDTWFQFEPLTQPGSPTIITIRQWSDSVRNDRDLAVRRQRLRYGT